MSLRAILLDIDGTLVDSNDAHAAAWSEASVEFGYDRPASFFRPLIGMGGDHVLPRIDPALKDDDNPGKAIAARRGEIFAANYLPTLTATPGAKALVEHMKHCGLQCVVASSAKADELDALLAVADIRDLIDTTTTSEEAAVSKPAPNIIETALQKAHVAADDVVLLGDTPYDITAAARAGVLVLALRCGGWDDLALAGALAIYDDPADLLAHYDHSALRP